jgi:glutathione synthase/RimK-type ligase-like ATP-grasp enzyme
VRQYYPVFEEMYRRIGLDIFGIDFAVKDGKVLVFEANACMKFLDRQHRADNRFAYLNDHVKTLKQAIREMLVQA